MPPVIEISRDHNPFPITGVSRDANGVPRYDELPATLLDMLAEQVDSRPRTEAVVEIAARGADRLTYRQLWDRASRVAGGLRAAGLKPGDRVALRYPAGTNWVLAFWGTVMAGGVAVAVNTRSVQPEVDFVLSDAGAHVDLAADTPLPDGQPYVSEQLDRADIAALFYTSGTTGHPKGVPTTHEAFLTNTENALRCLDQPSDLGEGMRTLISVPLFHVTGCNSQLLAATRLGGAAVIMPALNVDQLIATLTAERISVMVTVPAIYSLMLRHKDFTGTDVSGIRWVGYGGAPIAPSLVRTVKDSFAASHGVQRVRHDRDRLADDRASRPGCRRARRLGRICGPLGGSRRDPLRRRRARGGRVGSARRECDRRLLEPAGGHLGHDRGRLAAHRRRGSRRRRGSGAHHRSAQGHHQPGWRERLQRRGRSRAAGGARCRGRLRAGRSRRSHGRKGRRRPFRRPAADRRAGRARTLPRATGRLQGSAIRHGGRQCAAAQRRRQTAQGQAREQVQWGDPLR